MPKAKRLDNMVSFRASDDLREHLERIKDKAQRPLADTVRRLVELGIRALAGRKL